MPEAGRVKICGLCNRRDVLLADEAGADYLGAVLTPGFSRSVPEERVPGLMEGARARRVAVLVDEEPRRAAELAAALGAAVVQLHGKEAPAVVEAVAEAGPWEVWKAVRARSLDDVDRAVRRWGHLADGLLVEGWRDGVVGGGGVRLDGALARGLAERMPAGTTFVLAGGLTPDTVFDAVARFHPTVVDVSSGVERSLCEKDPEKVRRFVQEARRAWRTAESPTEQHPGATQ